MKNIYFILVLFIATVLFSCSSPEEKWITDYKQVKCDSVKLSEKVEEEIKKDLKDTLTAKETLEKDLKMLTAAEEKKIAGFNDALKKSDADFDKKIEEEKAELKNCKVTISDKDSKFGTLVLLKKPINLSFISSSLILQFGGNIITLDAKHSNNNLV